MIALDYCSKSEEEEEEEEEEEKGNARRRRILVSSEPRTPFPNLRERGNFSVSIIQSIAMSELDAIHIASVSRGLLASLL